MWTWSTDIQDTLEAVAAWRCSSGVGSSQSKIRVIFLCSGDASGWLRYLVGCLPVQLSVDHFKLQQQTSFKEGEVRVNDVWQQGGSWSLSLTVLIGVLVLTDLKPYTLFQIEVEVKMQSGHLLFKFCLFSLFLVIRFPVDPSGLQLYLKNTIWHLFLSQHLILLIRRTDSLISQDNNNNFSSSCCWCWFRHLQSISLSVCHVVASDVDPWKRLLCLSGFPLTVNI